MDHDGPALRINGRVAALDLSHAGTSAWLQRNEDVPLDALGVIHLSGAWEVDEAILAKLKGSGCVVGLGDYGDTLAAPLREAVLACRPTGLIVEQSPTASALLAEADRLRHLVYAGRILPRLARPEGLWTLMLLDIDAPAATPPPALPLDGVAAFGNLRVLSLGEIDDGNVRYESLAPLRRLAGLRSLVVPAPAGAADFEAITTLHGLEILVLNAQDIRDLGPLAGLDRLRRLSLTGLPEDVSGLEVLEDLPELKAVLFSSDTVKANQETLDRLRAARPDVIIQGFCLGSRWMAAIVAGGIVGALAIRLRGRRVSRCAGR